jgi:hypothetical protein
MKTMLTKETRQESLAQTIERIEKQWAHGGVTQLEMVTVICALRNRLEYVHRAAAIGDVAARLSIIEVSDLRMAAI